MPRQVAEHQVAGRVSSAPAPKRIKKMWHPRTQRTHLDSTAIHATRSSCNSSLPTLVSDSFSPSTSTATPSITTVAPPPLAFFPPPTASDCVAGRISTSITAPLSHSSSIHSGFGGGARVSPVSGSNSVEICVCAVGSANRSRCRGGWSTASPDE